MNIQNSASQRNEPVAPHTSSSPHQSPRLRRPITPPREIAGPCEHDVMCGRGIHSQNNSGNRRFRDVVNEYLDQYLKARTKREKSRIVQSIIARIHQSHGRFVRKDGDTGEWIEIDNHQAKEKVGHALRDAKQKRKKRREKEEQEEEATCFSELLRMQREIFVDFLRQDEEYMGQPCNFEYEELVPEQIVGV